MNLNGVVSTVMQKCLKNGIGNYGKGHFKVREGHFEVHKGLTMSIKGDIKIY